MLDNPQSPRWFNGSFVGLLKWVPTANGTITLPPGIPLSGNYLRTINSSGATEWTTQGGFSTLSASGNFTASGRVIRTPSSAQALVATTTISSTGGFTQVSTAADVTLTSNPAISTASAVAGQSLIVYQTSNFALTIPLSTVAFPSGVASVTLRQNEFALFVFNGSVWRMIATNGTENLTWTNLSLLNGFETNAGFQTPQYAKRGNQVFLRGMCQRSSSGLVTGTALCTLPVGHRPPGRLIFPQPSARCPSCDLDVEIGGNVSIQFTTTLAGFVFPSFDVISFFV